MSEWFPVLSGSLIIKLTKICFLWICVDQMTTQQRFNNLLQLQFYNIFSNDSSIFSKALTDILKIYNYLNAYPMPQPTSPLSDSYPFLSEFPILFLTVKLKLGNSYSQFIHRFKIWILKWWSWVVFPIHKRDAKLRFLKTLKSFSLRSFKIWIFEVPLPSYFVRWR